jgi:omega-6 fatty acid desaturase (delta-12 desaturase)
VEKFSWAWYFDTARKCKHYDFENKAWLDFEGNKTADSVRVVLSPAPAGQNG